MIDASHLLDQLLRDPLADSRRRGHGIGCVGPDIPLELLLGAGRPFGHLPWRVHEQTAWADQWLESGFPFWSRSILQQWHEGAFDELEHVVFSRADDASQRLFYYVRELQRRGKLRGPAPVMFDVAHVARQSSLLHTASAVAELMRTLDIGREQLLAGVRVAESLAERRAGIERQRDSAGPLHERLARAALWTDPTRWLGELEMPSASATGNRVLLAGSMPPDDRIHQAVESAGASIVAEAHPFGVGRETGRRPVDAAEPELALARNIRERSVAPRAFFDRAGWLVERVRSASVERVVVWLTVEDESLAWAVPAQRAALAAARIPALFLTAAPWHTGAGALARISAFCRGEHSATA